MNTEQVLVQTKLFIPPVQPRWLHRPRLVEMLNAGAQLPFTLVSAPPGYGKTSLLSEWVTHAARNRLPVAWLSLDGRDNDLTRFCHYLAGALGSIHLEVTCQGIPVSENLGDDMELWLTALINQIANVSGDFVLVLDDYQMITNPALHAAVAYLIERSPQQMHLVIASRVEPPLPLAQLRARGQMAEIKASHLRFNGEEIGRFFGEVVGLDLDESSLGMLEERTEGWIASLQLAALALQGRKDPAAFIRSFSGSHPFVMDYLAEQVLDQQPEEVRRFLLLTSVLDRLNAPLCEALTGERGAQRILQRLEKENLFLVALDDERAWYRYQRLFAHFLSERLRQADPQLWLDLHHRAAEWYERNGFTSDAVNHALAIGNATQALDLIEKIGETIWKRGEMARLDGWLREVPDEMIASRPRLCIYHAWILNISGEYKWVEQRLQAVEAWLAQADIEPEAEVNLVRGMLAATQAIIAIMEADLQRTLELCKQACERLPEENGVWRSVVARNLGNAHLIQGDLQTAEQDFLEAFRLSQSAGNVYMAIVSLYELACLYVIQGQLFKAESALQRGFRLADERNAAQLPIVATLYIEMGELLLQWNQGEEASHFAQRGYQLARQGRSLGMQLCSLSLIAATARARGDSERAGWALAQMDLFALEGRAPSFITQHDALSRLRLSRVNDITNDATTDLAIGVMHEVRLICKARELLRAGQVQMAATLLARLRSSAESGGRLGRLIEIQVLQAMAYQMQGNTRRALGVLESALLHSQNQGYQRVYLDEGPLMCTLLSTLSRKPHRVDPGYLERLLRGFSPASLAPQAEARHALRQEPMHGATPLEPLSDRELQVLRLIAAGLSNKEAAQELIMAQSTVQWHTKNIYRKLNVNSRTQASLRARQLGILAR